MEGPSIRLPLGETALGRDDGTGLLAFTGDTLVSRRHATLSVLDEPWRVRVQDLGSKNGTFINGRRIEAVGLLDGDLLRLGQSVFVLRWRHRSEEPASDLSGRAPAQGRMRDAIERIDGQARLVLLHGPPGCVFDDAIAAVHRRFNPEGRMQTFDARKTPVDDLSSVLAGAATVVVNGLTALPPHVISTVTASPMAPVILTSTEDPDSLTRRSAVPAAVMERFDAIIRFPRLSERRDDLLGLLQAALGDDSPPLTIDLIETLLVYQWPGDLQELIEVASELRIRGAGLDALVTELVSPRLQGHRFGALEEEGSKTEIDLRRPVPSQPDLEGLLAIHSGNVDSVAAVLGRSRLQVVAWMQHYSLETGEKG